MGADLLSKTEVAKILGGVSVSYVNVLLSKKKLAKIRLSYRVTRIPRASVEEFIHNSTVESRRTKKPPTQASRSF
jgi:excisionase family DNA binding protein